MVDPPSSVSRTGVRADGASAHLPHRVSRALMPSHRLLKPLTVVAFLLAGATWAFIPSGGGSTARLSAPRPPIAVGPTVEAALARHTSAESTHAASSVVTASTAESADALSLTEPAVFAGIFITTAVAKVEAAGIEPGANWNWYIGDTATYCGAIPGTGTGCTYKLSTGVEYSVFSGSPTLALVAHELANAVTMNDAAPYLLNKVSTAAKSTSWSPTDAVASCLVAHFMGFQDRSAGAWLCPVALATTVAATIHDSLSSDVASHQRIAA